MATTMIVWSYLVLVLAGGIIGRVKAGSRISLISALAAAVPLAICGLGVWPVWVAEVVVGALLVIFAIRYAKGGKFMPAGLMSLVSAVTLVLLLMV